MCWQIASSVGRRLPSIHTRLAKHSKSCTFYLAAANGMLAFSSVHRRCSPVLCCLCPVMVQPWFYRAPCNYSLCVCEHMRLRTPQSALQSRVVHLLGHILLSSLCGTCTQSECVNKHQGLISAQTQRGKWWYRQRPEPHPTHRVYCTGEYSVMHGHMCLNFCVAHVHSTVWATPWPWGLLVSWLSSCHLAPFVRGYRMLSRPGPQHLAAEVILGKRLYLGK